MGGDGKGGRVVRTENRVGAGSTITAACCCWHAGARRRVRAQQRRQRLTPRRGAARAPCRRKALSHSRRHALSCLATALPSTVHIEHAASTSCRVGPGGLARFWTGQGDTQKRDASSLLLSHFASPSCPRSRRSPHRVLAEGARSPLTSPCLTREAQKTGVRGRGESWGQRPRAFNALCESIRGSYLCLYEHAFNTAPMSLLCALSRSSGRFVLKQRKMEAPAGV